MARRRMPLSLAAALASLAVMAASLPAPALGGSIAAGPPPAFAAPVRLGFAAGDDWEPAVAADASGHVYVVWKHYDVAGSAATVCGDPSGCDQRILVQVSTDGGGSFGPPRALDPGRVGYDSQVVVDPADGRTVYASFLVGFKSSIGVTRSTDGGATWTPTTIADSLMRSVDKDILAVRGSDVYVAWNAAQKIYVSVSHDGGRTFSDVQADAGRQLGWSLPAGGTVLPDGTVLFGWAGYTQNGGAKGPVNLYVTRSRDGGRTWATTLLDVSGAPTSCSGCGWAFYGAQLTVAADAGGTVYAFENRSTVDFGPSRVYLRRSFDGGSTWTAATDLGLAPAGTNAAFPALAGAVAGTVNAAWMDDRTGAYRVYLRRSTDGGATWSGEAVLSADLGYPYQSAAGFTFPYGDYFELDAAGGRTVAAWGEGPAYAGPGNVFFSVGR